MMTDFLHYEAGARFLATFILKAPTTLRSTHVQTRKIKIKVAFYLGKPAVIYQ